MVLASVVFPSISSAPRAGLQACYLRLLKVGHLAVVFYAGGFASRSRVFLLCRRRVLHDPTLSFGIHFGRRWRSSSRRRQRRPQLLRFPLDHEGGVSLSSSSSYEVEQEMQRELCSSEEEEEEEAISGIGSMFWQLLAQVRRIVHEPSFFAGRGLDFRESASASANQPLVMCVYGTWK